MSVREKSSGVRRIVVAVVPFHSLAPFAPLRLKDDSAQVSTIVDKLYKNGADA